eukprot:jgi/Mesvir1/21415/Mv25933-RA.1
MRGCCMQFDCTPMHVAAQEAHLDIVEHLVTSGANKEAKAKVSFSSTLMAPSRSCTVSIHVQGKHVVGWAKGSTTDCVSLTTNFTGRYCDPSIGHAACGYCAVDKLGTHEMPVAHEVDGSAGQASWQQEPGTWIIDLSSTPVLRARNPRDSTHTTRVCGRVLQKPLVHPVRSCSQPLTRRPAVAIGKETAKSINARRVVNIQQQELNIFAGLLNGPTAHPQPQ